MNEIKTDQVPMKKVGLDVGFVFIYFLKIEGWWDTIRAIWSEPCLDNWTENEISFVIL